MEFDWDDANIEHVAEHGVEPEEVEAAVTDPRRLTENAYRGPDGELRRGVVGRTDAGRLLVVFLTVRNGKVRPVTARDADAAQKRRYRR